MRTKPEKSQNKSPDEYSNKFEDVTPARELGETYTRLIEQQQNYQHRLL